MINLKSHPVWQNIPPVKKPGHLARFFLAQQYAKLIPRSKLIGITGSVGKTTTAQACLKVLSEKFKVISSTETMKSVINLDPVFNLPMTILRVKSTTEKAIFEMGIEYRGEMELYLTLVKPATAIITKISAQHTEFLGGPEEIAQEKGKLVEQLPKDGYAILNWDDPLTRKLSSQTAAEAIFFGTDAKNCQVWASNIKIENFQTVFELNYGVERIVVHSQLLGKHLVYPMLAAAALGVSVDMPLVSIKKGLEKMAGSEHRMQAVDGINSSIIIDDTYNAAPTAMEEAIELINQVPARRRILALGEMRELGAISEKMHRNIARKIYKDKFDYCLLGGGDARFMADELISLGFNENRLFTNLTNQDMIDRLSEIVTKGDVVLVKGARSTKMEEVVKKLGRKKT